MGKPARPFPVRNYQTERREAMKEATLAKRKELKALSAALKNNVAHGIFPNVNAALVAFYHQQNPEIKAFDTYQGWKKQGRQVKRGAKAYLVWGKPKGATDPNQTEAPDPEAEDDSDTVFYPLCFLFADTDLNP
jgi:hypothetical protein